MPVAERVTSALTGGRASRLGERTVVLVAMASTLPIFWLGYGTDLDVAAVLRAGERIREGGYEPSRTPGVPVFEAVVAILDPVGGHLAVNLATVAAFLAAVVGSARLVRALGRPNGDLVALAFLACPTALIAGTSTADFMYALAFFVWGALAHLRSRHVTAGVLLGLSVGARSSTALVVAAFLLADAWPRERRQLGIKTALIAVPLGVLLYVPAWLAYDRTLGFLDQTNGWHGLANNLGRFAYKNYAVAGIIAVIVLLTAVPVLVRSLARWGTDPLVRFGALGFASTQALFLVVPWKLAHLLPSLLLLLFWLSATEWNRRPRLWLLVGALAVNGVVALRPLVPNDPDASRSASFQPAITVGYLVNDIRCRARFMDEPPRLESEAWPCTLEPLRGPSDPPPPAEGPDGPDPG